MPTLVPGASCLHQPLCTWNFQLNNTWMESPHLSLSHSSTIYIHASLSVFCMQELGISAGDFNQNMMHCWVLHPSKKKQGLGMCFCKSAHGHKPWFFFARSHPEQQACQQEAGLFFFLFALLIRCIKCIKSPSECTTAHPLACDQNCFIPCQFALPNNKFCRQKNLGNVMWIPAWGINSTGNFSFRCWRFPHPQKHCAGSHWPVAPF